MTQDNGLHGWDKIPRVDMYGQKKIYLKCTYHSHFFLTEDEHEAKLHDLYEHSIGHIPISSIEKSVDEAWERFVP